jgi:hypothetical protein
MWVTPFSTASRRTERLVAVPGRAEDARPGQLHGAEAHAAEGEIVGELEDAAGNRAGAAIHGGAAGDAVSLVHISISNVAVVF